MNALDELARSLAQPMPRARAVRLLGGALASAAVSGVFPRGARSAPRRAAGPCDCVAGETPCAIPLGAGCTKVCCVQTGNYPKCCSTVGVEKPAPNCATHPGGVFGGVTSPPRTVCCCPAGARCGDLRAGESGCMNCTLPCGSGCCNPGEFCAAPAQSLCCKTGESACGDICCKTGQFCANRKTALCCNAGQVGCGDKCCPQGKVCRHKACGCPTGTKKCGSTECCTRNEVCTSVRPGHRQQTCCPKTRWTGSGCCPSGTVGRRTPSQSCCPPGNPDCCQGVTCGLFKTCVSGVCRRI